MRPDSAAVASPRVPPRRLPEADNSSISQKQLDKIRRIYDSDPGNYDRACSSGVSKRLLESRRARLAAMVQPGQRVLEIGIGTGLTLLHYPAGTDVTGIDLSPKMLALAQERATRLGDRLTADLRVMDAEALEFPDESFDVVLFTLCLCTIPDARRAVAEGLRVCKRGGRLGFLEHVRSNLLPIALLQEAITPVLAWAQHDFWNRRTADTIRSAGVADLTEERWMLGVFSLMTGSKR